MITQNSKQILAKMDTLSKQAKSEQFNKLFAMYHNAKLTLRIDYDTDQSIMFVSVYSIDQFESIEQAFNKDYLKARVTKLYFAEYNKPRLYKLVLLYNLINTINAANTQNWRVIVSIKLGNFSIYSVIAELTKCYAKF